MSNEKKTSIIIITFEAKTFDASILKKRGGLG